MLRFSNGLVAYFFGDTGITAEQDKVVAGLIVSRVVIPRGTPKHD